MSQPTGFVTFSPRISYKIRQTLAEQDSDNMKVSEGSNDYEIDLKAMTVTLQGGSTHPIQKKTVGSGM
jgi:hypothetical protein